MRALAVASAAAWASRCSGSRLLGARESPDLVRSGQSSNPACRSAIGWAPQHPSTPAPRRGSRTRQSHILARVRRPLTPIVLADVMDGAGGGDAPSSFPPHQCRFPLARRPSKFISTGSLSSILAPEIGRASFLRAQKFIEMERCCPALRSTERGPDWKP